MSLILVIITAALVDNVVLSQFYGLCPFLGVQAGQDGCRHGCGDRLCRNGIVGDLCDSL